MSVSNVATEASKVFFRFAALKGFEGSEVRTLMFIQSSAVAGLVWLVNFISPPETSKQENPKGTCRIRAKINHGHLHQTM